MASKRTSGTGNGDTCPVAVGHGAMMVLVSGLQYCPDQSHDPHGKKPGTRNLWPGGHVSFAAAVAEYHGATTKAAGEPSALPELDITLEV